MKRSEITLPKEQVILGPAHYYYYVTSYIPNLLFTPILYVAILNVIAMVTVVVDCNNVQRYVVLVYTNIKMFNIDSRLVELKQ